jgi:phosphatidylglycerol---prolipoprotein diacylglyceryl transferase
MPTLPAAIPFFGLSVYNLDVPGIGSLPLDPWATLVCIGFVVGLEIARFRAIRLGLDVRDIVDGAVFIVLSGFFWAHVVTVLFYFPERLQTDGIMSILRVWEGFSSTGGFLGAVIGAWLFYRVIRPRGALRHADVIAFGFPFGWFFGRLGCGVVHDHVGALTTFPLAMNFDRGFEPYWADGSPFIDGIRHELGLYEAALLIPLMIAFWRLGQRDRVPGFFLGVFALYYAPVRFLLDFLRNTDLEHQDARYLGMTPAQYGMIAMFVAAAAFLYYVLQQGWPKPAAEAPGGSPTEAFREGAPPKAQPGSPGGVDPSGASSDDGR